MSLEVKCSRCNQALSHVCSMDLAHEAKRIMEFSIGLEVNPAVIKLMQESNYYAKGDEDTPFFSEAFLYCLLGKDAARTVLARLHHLICATGLDPNSGEV